MGGDDVLKKVTKSLPPAIMPAMKGAIPCIAQIELPFKLRVMRPIDLFVLGEYAAWRSLFCLPNPVTNAV